MMMFGNRKAKFVAPEDVGPSRAPLLTVVPGTVEGGEVVDLRPVAAPERPHVYAAHVVAVSKHPDLFDKELVSYRVSCSCSWEGVSFDRVDPEEEVFDAMAEAWSEHVSLSYRVFQLAKKLRRQQKATAL